MSARSLPIVSLTGSNFAAEIALGKATGNYSFVTNAGLRLAVQSGDPAEVSRYLMEEMGIKATVTRDADGVLIGFRQFDLYSPATVTRALHGAFKTLSAMTKDGRQAIKIYSA